ncbi:MAG: hypothetical protein ABIA74_05055 [bacterium]
MKKRLFLFIFLVFGLVNLSAYLTDEEQREILEKCEITDGNQPEIKATLDLFFEDASVKEVLIDRKRIFDLGWMYRNIKPSERTVSYIHAHSDEMFIPSREDLEKIKTIKDRFNIKFLPAGPYLIDNLLFGYVVKIPRFNVPLIGDPGKDIYQYFNEEKSKELCDPYFDKAISKYQLVSRVFYNQKINDFVKAKNFKYVYPIEEYLYNLPGKEREVCDENYVVIQENIDLPLVSTNAALFRKLFSYSCFPRILESEKEDIFLRELLTELFAVIEYAGLWDMTPQNVFLGSVANDKLKLKVAFVGAVRPAFTGSEERHFFHKDPDEIKRNAKAGFEGLAKLFGISYEQLMQIKELFVDSNN